MEKKISDEELIEERLKGKTLSKICEEYGYEKGSENYLQKRLKDHGWNIDLNSKDWVKLNRLGENTWSVPLNKSTMNKAELDSKKRYDVNREVMGPHKILLRFSKSIGDEDENEKRKN